MEIKANYLQFLLSVLSAIKLFHHSQKKVQEKDACVLHACLLICFHITKRIWRKNLKRIMILFVGSFPSKSSKDNILHIFGLFVVYPSNSISRFNYSSSKEKWFLCAELFVILKSNTYAEYFVFFNKVQIIPKVIFSTC